MLKRESIVSDYFKLHILLNRGNKNPNEKTDLIFFISESKLNQLEFLAGIKEGSSIQLCVTDLRQSWEWSGVSGLNALVEFCAKRLQDHQSKIWHDKSQKLTSVQKKKICDSVVNELRNLIVNQNV